MADLCQVLTKVRTEILTGPEKWTQRTYARNKHGHPCDFDNAVCFCFAGAVQRAMDCMNIPGFEQVGLFSELNTKMIKRYDASIIAFNDYDAKTFDDITRAIDTIKEEVCQ